MRHLGTTDRRALRLQLDTMRRQVFDELRASAPSAEAALAENGHEVKTMPMKPKRSAPATCTWPKWRSIAPGSRRSSRRSRVWRADATASAKTAPTRSRAHGSWPGPPPSVARPARRRRKRAAGTEPATLHQLPLPRRSAFSFLFFDFPSFFALRDALPFSSPTCWWSTVCSKAFLTFPVAASSRP